MADKDKNEKKFVSPEFRLSFPKIFLTKKDEEKEKETGKKVKREVNMLIDKKVNIKHMYNMVAEAATEKWGEKAKDMIKNGKIKVPFADGDTKEWDGYEGNNVVRASTYFQPQVIDLKTKKEITTEADFYAGCYAKASLSVYAGTFKDDETGMKTKYVKFNLHNLLKTKDGEKFSSHSDAYDDFDIDATEEFADSEESYSDSDGDETPDWMKD